MSRVQEYRNSTGQENLGRKVWPVSLRWWGYFQAQALDILVSGSTAFRNQEF